MTGTRFSWRAILFSPQIDLSGMPGMITSRAAITLVLVMISLVIAPLASGCLSTNSGTGTLTGNVTIGPLCPVEPCTLSQDRLVAAYAARPITISKPSGSVAAMVTADPETGYSVDLMPGTYLVDVPHQGIGGTRELPETVTISGGETVRLNISIDTGIR
jgi:hypothetical protein